MLLAGKFGKCILTHNMNVTFYKKERVRMKITLLIQLLNSEHALHFKHVAQSFVMCQLQHEWT